MLLLTRSSFLYPYNNWDDANSYLSMGKSMMHGAVIYRDLFDQKGPYLYFLYGLSSLISRTDFAGVFAMEVLFGAIDLWLLRRILGLYCSGRTSLALAPILFSCMCASKSFYWGGSAEELCLPFLLWPLYVLLRTLEEGNRFRKEAGSPKPAAAVGESPAAEDQGTSLCKGRGDRRDALSGGVHFRARDVFTAGLCCGVVFNIKFTLMGFYLAFAIAVILTCRSMREFRSLALWYLLGILLPFVPWILYFAANGALYDWYYVYIYTNVFVYSDFGANSHGETMGSRIYDLAKLLYWLILDNYQYFVFILLGMAWMLLRRGVSLVLRLSPVLLFSLTFFFIYIGGATLPYYAVPLTILAAVGMGLVGSLIDRLAARLSRAKAKEAGAADKTQEGRVTEGAVRGAAGPGAVTAKAEKIRGTKETEETKKTKETKETKSRRSCLLTGLLVAGTSLFSLGICYHYSWNTYYLSYEKEDVFLFAFAADIEADRAAGRADAGNATLLNIGCLDCGLYTAADIYPTCYWFQTQTLPGDEVTSEQLRYITEAQTSYVVARDTYPDAIYEHYELIDSFHQVMGTTEFDYYLFRRMEE